MVWCFFYLLYIYVYITHSLILSTLSGTWDDSMGSPSGSACSCSAEHFVIQSSGIEIFFHSAPPCLCWSSPHSHALRCSSEGCSGDGVGGHAADMSEPPPPPCRYNFNQSAHSFYIYQFIVRDGSGLVNHMRMRRRHLVRNTSSFRWNVAVVIQHSAPYGGRATYCFRRFLS